jgi:integrase
VTQRIPKYRRHKASGQAVVTLAGGDHYLGKYNSKASKVKYKRLVGEWLVRGFQVGDNSDDLTIAELIVGFLKYARSRYVKDGQPTSELDEYRQALRPLRELYGDTLAAAFGPLALKNIRQGMVDRGLSRGVVNHRIGRIRHMFKWAASDELLPIDCFDRLAVVEGLRNGQTTAPESAPILPVADEIVLATLPFLPATVAAMVQFQRYTGCRPGEVCIIRPGDIDRTAEIWTYRPASHKTEHHGLDRLIFIGPMAQAVLLPYLVRGDGDYCFVPAQSMRQVNAKRRANRKSPMTPSQKRRRPKRTPRRALGGRYTTDSYRRAIERAVMLANRSAARQAPKAGTEAKIIPRWYPIQLFQSFAGRGKCRDLMPRAWSP